MKKLFCVDGAQQGQLFLVGYISKCCMTYIT